MSLLIVVTFFFFFISDAVSEQKKPENQFNWSGIRPQIKDTVIALSDYGCITNYRVGLFGDISYQWYRANWFKENASAEELKQLLYYNDGVIRGYAFDGLVLKKDTMIFEYMKDSFNDSIIVYTLYGCVGTGVQLWEYYLSTNLKKNGYRFNQQQKNELDSLIELKKNEYRH